MNTEQIGPTIGLTTKYIYTKFAKAKGDMQECRDYRGIKVLSHTFETWEKVVGRRIRQCTNIHESQVGAQHMRFSYCNASLTRGRIYGEWAYECSSPLIRNDRK